MVSKKKFTVGQQVVISNHYTGRRGGFTREVVTKVGRTIVYTARTAGSTYPINSFYMEDGRETGTYSRQHVYTVEEWETMQERSELREVLKKRGIEFVWHRERHYDVERLRALVAATEGVEEA